MLLYKRYALENIKKCEKVNKSQTLIDIPVVKLLLEMFGFWLIIFCYLAINLTKLTIPMKYILIYQ